jgi:hypothetical protein
MKNNRRHYLASSSSSSSLHFQKISLQTGSRVHTTSYPMSTGGYFPKVKKAAARS